MVVARLGGHNRLKSEASRRGNARPHGSVNDHKARRPLGSVRAAGVGLCIHRGTIHIGAGTALFDRHGLLDIHERQR